MRTIPSHLKVTKTYYAHNQILKLSNGSFLVFNSSRGEYITRRSYEEALITRQNLLSSESRNKNVDYPTA